MAGGQETSEKMVYETVFGEETLTSKRNPSLMTWVRVPKNLCRSTRSSIGQCTHHLTL